MKTTNRMIILIWFLGLTSFACIKEAQPQKLAVLPEIQDPYNTMWASENRLWVTDASDALQKRSTILVYSLEDYHLEKRFGGPSVFEIQPAHSVFLFLSPDRFAVNSSGKVSIYDYSFEPLQELDHGRDSFFYVPFGDKFLARQVYSENNISYYRLNLYDSELNLIRELCRKKFAGRAFSGDFSFDVYGENVYVARRTDGFTIEVFDRMGNLVKSINHDCSRVKVTQADRDQHMSRLLNRPGWERYFSSREEMEEHYKNLIEFPEFFPAIAALHLADDQIYVRTSTQTDNTREFWILDLDGQVCAKKMVPFEMQTEQVWCPYAIRNKHLYQLILNERTDEWELFSVDIFNTSSAPESVPGSCTIFAASFGDTVLYGNNEDYNIPNTYYWVRPSGKDIYGGVYVGFDNFSPQGGINEKGLAFDYNALPEAPLNPRPELPDKGGIMGKIQRTCATVEEAIALAKKHNWGSSLRWQVLMADATGDAAVFSAGPDGELAFTRKPKGDGYLVSTNFNRANPKNTYRGSYPCWRYDKAVEMLDKIESEEDLTVDYFKSILDAAHVESAIGNTLYSNVFDLKNGVIYLYHWHQFGEVATLKVAEEIAKRPKPTRIRDLFSEETVRRAEEEHLRYKIKK
jgi:hypothetical protein